MAAKSSSVTFDCIYFINAFWATMRARVYVVWAPYQLVMQPTVSYNLFTGCDKWNVFRSLSRLVRVCEYREWVCMFIARKTKDLMTRYAINLYRVCFLLPGDTTMTAYVFGRDAVLHASFSQIGLHAHSILFFLLKWRSSKTLHISCVYVSTYAGIIDSSLCDKNKK